MEVKLQNNEVLKSIASRLESIDKRKGINTIKEEEESIQDSESDIQEINKIRNNFRSKKPYYKRHTPPDLLFEESKYYGGSYTGDSITTWDLDGLSEYEILKLLQEMAMAATAYKAKEMTDKQACILLVTGFSGALRHWWDNSLGEYDRQKIINHTERIIKQEDEFYEEEFKENAVEVLLHTITMHFIGNPNEELESKKIILTNLRCPTLGDFKWYKDVFIANIYLRPDCNQPFWKERFVMGLPSFFAERVIKKLNEYTGGNTFDWNTITYGQLFAFIKKEGLTICQEQKDKKRNEKFKFKLNMGEFCRQYGYEKLNPPSRQKRMQNKPHKRFSKRKHFQKQSNKKQNEQYYSKNKNYKNKYTNKQKIICWNCKRPGHRSTECKMKRKINEIFQDQPDMQEKFTKLLISETETSSEDESIYSINEIEDSSDSTSESQEYSDDLCNCKQINVITRNDKQILLEIIDKIDDPEVKKNIY